MLKAYRIELRAIIYPDDGAYVAHCLELDIAAEGRTPREAAIAVISLCDYQIETAIKDGNVDRIFRAAPPELWDLYSKATNFRPKRGVALPRSVSGFDVRELVFA